MSKSKSIDLVEKKYDSKLSGEWIGFPIMSLIFTNLYINKHYSKLVHYLPYIELYVFYDKKNKSKLGIIDFSLEPSIVYNFNKDKKIFENYYKLFKDTDKRFTYFPVNQCLGKESNAGCHLFFFIYDKLYNEVELFDSIPQGYNEMLFNNFFKKIYGKNIKILYPRIFEKSLCEIQYLNCKNFNDKFKSEGYCVVAALWRLELILKNQNLSRRKIQIKALKLLENGGTRICKLIIGYAQFIQKINKNIKITESKETGDLKITTTNKKVYIIPNNLIVLLGVSGAFIYIIKKLKLIPRV